MKDQKGFGAVEVIIIAVIVGVIGLGGWFVRSKNKKTTSTATPALNTPNRIYSAQLSQDGIYVHS